MREDNIEKELEQEDKKAAYLRKVNGQEDDKNRQSQGSGIFAALFRNAIFDESPVESRSPVSQRPKSSPGFSRSHMSGKDGMALSKMRARTSRYQLRPITSQSRRRPPK